MRPQLRTLFLTLAGLPLVALVILQTGISLWNFTGDPSTITNNAPVHDCQRPRSPADII